MNTRYAGVFVLSFLVSCLPLSGGGQKDKQDGEPIPIRYISYWGDPHYKYDEMELVALFEDEFPEYEVFLRAVPYEEYDQTLKTYLLSGSDQPDLLCAETGFSLNQLVETGRVSNVISYLDKFDPDGTQRTIYEKYPVNRKGLFYLPVSSYSWGIYYKPSLFTRLGLEIPENWEQFLRLCSQLQKADMIPLSLGTRYAWTAEAWFDYLDLRINGPAFHEKLMAGEISFPDQRINHVERVWEKLVDAGYFPENAGSLSWLEALDLFEEDRAGMYLMGDFLINAVHPGRSDDLDLFPFPAVDGNIPSAEIAPSEGYIIPSEAVQPRGAAELLGFILKQKMITPVNKKSASLELDRKIQELIQGADILFQVHEKELNPDTARSLQFQKSLYEFTGLIR